jgi:twitching motility protein PilJ
MKRLKYSRLFLLIGTLLLAPFLLMLYLQESGVSSDITFNKRESDGVRYITPVQGLLHALQDHRNYDVAALSGMTQAGAARDQAEASIDRLIAAVDDAEDSYGASMSNAAGENMSAAPWSAFKTKWGTVRDRNFTSAEESAQAHAEVIAAVNDFIVNVLANYSNLILDPDLDSYWLMDSYVARVPAMSEALGAASAVSMRAAAGQELTQGERFELVALLSRAELLMTELDTNLGIAYGNNASGEVRPALESLQTDTGGAVRQYVSFLRSSVLEAETTRTDVETVATRSANVTAQVHDFFAKIGPQLDKLCMTRVGKYKTTRAQGLIVGVGAMLLLIYVLGGFYLYLATEITNTLNETQSLRGKAERENEELQGNIMNMLSVVAEVADGDLTKRVVVTEGALGNMADALNQMLESWQEVLADAMLATQETGRATQRITDVSKRVTEGANRQLEVLREVEETVQEISRRILHVSEGASTAAEAAARTQESAVTGATSVTNVVQGMEGLRANVQAGAKKIKNLGDRSMEISGIVATIAKISEQTNMLALNAAIEAARAGEQGRGFSVVADEVRKLAERTASATEEISKLVTGIQAETAESVQAIEEQTHAVEQEAQVVSRAGEALLKIQGESTQSAGLIGDISQTARDQVRVVEQAVTSMERVSKIASDAARSSAESLELTDTLDQMSRKLTQSMSRFRLARR